MTPRFLVLAFLLASATPSRAADPGELLAGRSKDCPDCLLAGARLKRFDLSEADLAGANLAGAVLHRAQLAGANLSRANLTGANLNKTDLKHANLAGARLGQAMLFEAARQRGWRVSNRSC